MDVELVQNTLEEKYPLDDSENSTFDQTPQHNHTDIDFWGMLGVRDKSNESTSSSRSEIEQFMRFPRAKTDVDPLQWWYMNRFVSHLLMLISYYPSFFWNLLLETLLIMV